jgi:hypothetical protein
VIVCRVSATKAGKGGKTVTLIAGLGLADEHLKVQVLSIIVFASFYADPSILGMPCCFIDDNRFQRIPQLLKLDGLICMYVCMYVCM